jgi:hypothetical protein
MAEGPIVCNTGPLIALAMVGLIDRAVAEAREEEPRIS